MKNLSLFLILALSLFVAIGCDTKDDNPVTSDSNTVRFTTAQNVKTTPTFFSFDTGTTTDTLGAWDVMFGTIGVPAGPGMTVQFPAIRLNRGRAVSAKIVDGTEFASVNGATVSGLTADTDTSYAIGMECLDYDDASHQLSPYANRTFVLQTGAGTRVKFKMVSYYSEAGASGFMTLDYVKY